MPWVHFGCDFDFGVSKVRYVAFKAGQRFKVTDGCAKAARRAGKARIVHPPARDAFDRLRAYVLLLHARAERDRLKSRIAELEQREMTTKLRGVGEAVRKLRSRLDDSAEDLVKRIEEIGNRSETATKKVRAELDAHAATVNDLDRLADELKGDNGAPVA